MRYYHHHDSRHGKVGGIGNKMTFMLESRRNGFIWPLNLLQLRKKERNMERKKSAPFFVVADFLKSSLFEDCHCVTYTCVTCMKVQKLGCET